MSILYIHVENILMFEFQPYQDLSQFVMIRKVKIYWKWNNVKDLT